MAARSTSRMGIIEVNVKMRSSELMRQLTKVNCDYVGFFYPNPHDPHQTLTSLYNMYTGVSLNASLTVEQIKREEASVYVRTHAITAHHKRFQQAIGRILMNHLVRPDLSQIRRRLRDVLAMAAKSQPVPLQGYAIVNQALYASMNKDYSQHKSMFNLAKLPHLDTPHVVKSTTPTQYVDSDIFDTGLDVDTIFAILKDLYVAETVNSNVLTTVLTNTSSEDGIFGFTPMVQTTDEVESGIHDLHASLTSVVNQIHDGIPTVNIHGLLNQVTRLGQALGIDTLTTPTMKQGSFPALLLTSLHEKDEGRINLTLKSGNVIVLPTHGADLEHLDIDTLTELAWYLESLAEVDAMYLPLRTQTIRELALRRQKSRHT